MSRQSCCNAGWELDNSFWDIPTHGKVRIPPTWYPSNFTSCPMDIQARRCVLCLILKENYTFSTSVQGTKFILCSVHMASFSCVIALNGITTFIMLAHCSTRVDNLTWIVEAQHSRSYTHPIWHTKGNPNYAVYAVSESEIWADLILDERDVDQFRAIRGPRALTINNPICM